MTFDLPQIVKDAQRARAAIEEAFIRMARRHKYHTGADIRNASKIVVQLALRAWRDRDRRSALAAELAVAIDALKLELQLGKDVGAFRRFAEFEAIVRLVDGVGAQCGAWINSLRQKSQNAQAKLPLEQRAQTLSSRPAHEARV